MGIYARWILPRLIDLAMRNREAAAERARLVPEASGVVLEVGIGSGLNLPFYGPRVERLYGLDPSLRLWALGRRRRACAAFPVEFLHGLAERIPLATATVDTVVMTWTLCSIPDPSRALQEMRRVLRPEGQLLFVEHGLAPDPGVVTWQDRLNPLWTRLAGGCNLNRRIDRLIEGAGFTLARVDRGYGTGPRPMSYLYRGLARPAPARQEY